MPRVSRQQTETNRAAIEEAAARLFREQGFKAVSVNDLMGAAGLTHGGFYGHFASKDALLAAACEKTFADSTARWSARCDSVADKHAAFDALASNYLSARSRDNAGAGCPAAALAADVAREDADAPVRASYVAGTRQLLAQLARMADGDDAAAREQHAMQALAMMVGALTLARATEGDPVSDAILAAALASLHAH